MRIITIGETTYDIRFREGNPTGSAVGGSQLNSAVSLCRCRLPVLFVTSVGNDTIGNHSVGFLQENGVDTTAVSRFDGNSRIALAFTNEQGDAQYAIYPATKSVAPHYPVPQPNDIVLFGSSFALKGEGRSELLAFLISAKACGATVIYDPNIRQDLRNDLQKMKWLEQNLALATIVKGSSDDFQLIGTFSNDEAVYRWVKRFGARILLITKGAEGASLLSDKICFSLPAIETEVVNTIGAGDNFSAGVIYALAQYVEKKDFDIQRFTEKEWKPVIENGLRFAGHVCTQEQSYISIDFASVV